MPNQIFIFYTWVNSKFNRQLMYNVLMNPITCTFDLVQHACNAIMVLTHCYLCSSKHIFCFGKYLTIQTIKTLNGNKKFKNLKRSNLNYLWK